MCSPATKDVTRADELPPWIGDTNRRTKADDQPDRARRRLDAAPARPCFRSSRSSPARTSVTLERPPGTRSRADREPNRQPQRSPAAPHCSVPPPRTRTARRDRWALARTDPPKTTSHPAIWPQAQSTRAGSSLWKPFRRPNATGRSSVWGPRRPAVRHSRLMLIRLPPLGRTALPLDLRRNRAFQVWRGRPSRVRWTPGVLGCESGRTTLLCSRWRSEPAKHGQRCAWS